MVLNFFLKWPYNIKNSQRKRNKVKERDKKQQYTNKNNDPQ